MLTSSQTALAESLSETLKSPPAKKLTRLDDPNTEHVRNAVLNEPVYGKVAVEADEIGHGLTWRKALQEGDRRLSLQELELAEGCYRQAARQVRKDKTASPDDVALCLRKLAQLMQQLSVSEEAIDLYTAAIKIEARAHGENSPLLVPDLLALGAISENDGDLKQARKVIDRAMAIANASTSDPLLQAKALHDFGHLEFDRSRTASAEQSYNAALSILMAQKVLPSSDLLDKVIADYTDLLEKNYGRAKNLNFAVNEELLKDRLSVLEQKKGVAPSAFEREVSSRLARETLARIPQSELTATTAANQLQAPAEAAAVPLHGLTAEEQKIISPLQTIPDPSTPGDPVSREGIDKQKVAFYERMIAVDIKSLGREHPSVARDLSGLSALYMASGQYDQARILLQRAAMIYEKVYGKDSALSQRVRAMLALVNENQIAQQSGTASGDRFVETLAPLPLAAQKIDIAIRLNYLGALCYSLGRLPEARRIYDWTIADIYYCTGDQNLLMSAALGDYARVLRSSGNIKQATLYEEDARSIKRKAVSSQIVKAVR